MGSKHLPKLVQTQWQPAPKTSIATTAVGGVKLGYAFLAAQAGFIHPQSHSSRGISRVAGMVMVAVGIGMLLK